MPTEIDSPCLGVCVMDARSGMCHGCFRTPDEIQMWPSATPAEKETTLAALQARRLAAGLPASPFVKKTEEA